MEGSESSSSSSHSEGKSESTKVAYSVTYAMPGKVAFCVPKISDDPQYRQRLLALLQAESWVTSQQVNPIAGSVVIGYNPGAMSDFEMRSRIHTLLQTAIDAELNNQQAITKPPTSPQPEAVTHPQTTAERAKVAYTIVHAIPGRVRFHVPQVVSDAKYVQRLEALLKADPLVTSGRINRDAASIVVTYKTGEQKVFAATVSHLASLIESANEPTAGVAVNTSSRI